MKNIKKLALILCLLALVWNLAGCFGSPKPTDPPTDPPTAPPTDPTPPPTDPPLTAQTLLERMGEAIGDRELHQVTADLDLDMTMNMKTDGFRFSVDMGMDFKVDILANQDPRTMYMDMTMSLDAMGQNQAEQATFYVVTEEDQTVCYAYSPSARLWQRMEMDLSDQNGDSSDEPMEPPEFILDEETVKVEQREAYLLRFTLDADIINKFIKPFASSGIQPLGLSNTEEDPAEEARVEVVMYVDTETSMPIRMEMNFLGIDDMINELIPEGSGMPSFELSMTADSTADQSMGFEFSTFRLVLTDLGFDPVEIPAVPEEAYTYLAMYEYDPLQEDGSYILTELDTAARITPLEGWYELDRGYNWLCLCDESEEHYADIYLYPDMGRQDMSRFVLSTFVTPLDYTGNLESYAYGDMIWKYYTMVVHKQSGDTIYLAWGRVGSGWVLIYVEDYCENGCSTENILKPFVVSITEADPVN